LPCHGCGPLREGEAPAEAKSCRAVRSCGSAGASPSRGVCGSAGASPSRGVCGSAGASPSRGFGGSAGASPSRGFAARREPRPPEVLRLGGSLALPRFCGSPLDDSVRGVFRGQNTSLHRVLHFALSQKNAAVPGRDSGAGRGEISRSDQAAAESRRGIFRSPRTISSVTTNF